jgi:hypothetical protein
MSTGRAMLFPAIFRLVHLFSITYFFGRFFKAMLFPAIFRLEKAS